MDVDTPVERVSHGEDHEAHDGPEPITSRRLWRNRTPLIVVLVLTLVGVGSVMYDAFAPVTQEPLGTHGHAVVQQACDNAYRTLKALPPLQRTSSLAEVVARTHQEDTIFDEMVAKFDTVQPSSKDGRTALRDWSADWRSVIARRAGYVRNVAVAHDKFVLPIDSSGAPVTDRMNQYSRTHSLNQCLTENLQLETVETVRAYPPTDTQTDT